MASDNDGWNVNHKQSITVASEFCKGLDTPGNFVACNSCNSPVAELLHPSYNPVTTVAVAWCIEALTITLVAQEATFSKTMAVIISCISLGTAPATANFTK